MRSRGRRVGRAVRRCGRKQDGAGAMGWTAIRLALIGLVSMIGCVRAGLAEPVRTPESGARALEAPARVEGFTFAVFGDRVPGSDGGLEILSRAVSTANHLGARFVVTTGNMVQGDTRLDEWRRRVDDYRSVLARLEAPWYPVRGPLDAAVRGEGDAARDRLYAERFGPSAYAFEVEWAQVIVLPSGALRERGPERERVLAWLGDELAQSDADQVFVIVHAPLWRAEGGARGDAWDAVHDLLADDGRPARGISGGTLYAREDPQRDNVRYCSVSMTGAFASETHEYASSQSIALVHVSRDGHEMTVLPHDAASSSDSFSGRDAEAVRALAESGWASVEGFLQAGPEPGDGAAFEVMLENPTDSRIRYAVESIAPEGWVLSRERIAGSLEPGQTLQLPFAAEAPALDSERPEIEVMVTARYPVSSGGEQPVVRRLAVPVRPRGAESAASATPSSNGVLALDGRGAVRVDLGERPWRMTIEAWVKGPEPSGNAAVVSRFADGAGMGIVWSRPGGVLPAGLVGTARGVVLAGLDEPIEWDAWHHVAMTYDGDDATLFVDGRAVARGSGGDLVVGDAPVYIGAEPNDRGDPVSMFSGMIDEVRVSSSVRYAEGFEPDRVHETDADTLLLLHFDRPYHGAHPDDSGRGHHGWTVGRVRIVREDLD